MDEPTYDLINNAIEELYEQPVDGSPNNLTGPTRVALDTAFGHKSVEEIINALEQLAASTPGDAVGTWAQQTLKELHLRSPTSLRIALEAVRRGKQMKLADALRMELGIATALLVCMRFQCIIFPFIDCFNQI
jgi:3-hydroxyisobutyryl-CoA hydrolase